MIFQKTRQMLLLVIIGLSSVVCATDGLTQVKRDQEAYDQASSYTTTVFNRRHKLSIANSFDSEYAAECCEAYGPVLNHSIGSRMYATITVTPEGTILRLAKKEPGAQQITDWTETKWCGGEIDQAASFFDQVIAAYKRAEKRNRTTRAAEEDGYSSSDSVETIAHRRR